MTPLWSKSKQKCSAKVRHPTTKAVRTAIAFGRSRGVTLVGYKCKECGYYHVTRQIFTDYDLRDLKQLMSRANRVSSH